MGRRRKPGYTLPGEGIAQAIAFFYLLNTYVIENHQKLLNSLLGEGCGRNE